MTARTREHLLDAAEFEALYLRLRQAPSWGPTDRRGALNYLTQGRVLTAAGEIRLGRTVSLAAPIETGQTPDDPDPAVHEMTGPPGHQADARGLTFARDRLSINVHGNADSHIDALCHAMYRKTLYNGVSADAVTRRAAKELSIEVARDGIAGRGVLLDIPRLRGVPWIEPGDFVTAAELARAAEAQRVDIDAGDLLFVRVGHRRRRDELGPWDAAQARAGLHPAALEFIAERKVAVLGSDSNSDTAPSPAEGVDLPVHVLAINALGLHLVDYLRFDDLVPLCEATGRWSFFCVIAPLRLPGGTGSPVNPIAVM
ncbi:MAG TPA: cyclase family protein [Trebonia sp.]|jgi:kynurenine formamidase|nr:cyclase family protein [Trebonia sp.]